MSLTVKAYLHLQDESHGLFESPVDHVEIRRFTVDQEVATNYEYLVRKIAMTFPRLQNKSFTLYWTDNEGDHVTVSSDDELTTALGHVTDAIFRIHIDDVIVIPQPRPPPAYETMGGACGSAGAAWEESGEKRRDLIGGWAECDGCDGLIVGKRFKCMTCVNFDLCEGCRSTGLHCEHPFDEIEGYCEGVTTLHGGFGQRPFTFNTFRDGRPFSRMFSPPPAWFRHIPPQAFRDWFARMKAGSVGGPNDRAKMCRAWRRWWRKMRLYGEGLTRSSTTTEASENVNKSKNVNKAENANGEATGKDTEKTEANKEETKVKLETSEKQKENESMEKEDLKQSSGQNKEKLDDNETDSSDDDEEVTEEEKKFHLEFMRTIGQALGSFIGPFVDGYAQGKKKGRDTTASATAGSNCPGQETEQKYQTTSCSGTQNCEERQTNMEAFPECNVFADAHGPRVLYQCYPRLPTGAEGGYEGGQCYPKLPSGAEGAFEGACGDAREGGSSASDGVGSGQAGQQTQPGSAEGMATSEERNADEVIATALSIMYSLGFTDDDGSLTALLLAHRGDINRVLDELHACTATNVAPARAQAPARA